MTIIFLIGLGAFLWGIYALFGKTIVEYVLLGVLGFLVGALVFLQFVSRYMVSAVEPQAYVYYDEATNSICRGLLDDSLEVVPGSTVCGLTWLKNGSLKVSNNYGAQVTANVNKLEPKVSDVYLQWAPVDNNQ